MMDSSQTAWTHLERVIARALGAEVTCTELQQAARLDDLVALDSVALLEFAIGVEREFSIRFENERLNRDFLTNLPELIAYLSQRQADEASAGGQA